MSLGNDVVEADSDRKHEASMSSSSSTKNTGRHGDSQPVAAISEGSLRRKRGGGVWIRQPAVANISCEETGRTEGKKSEQLNRVVSPGLFSPSAATNYKELAFSLAVSPALTCRTLREKHAINYQN